MFVYNNAIVKIMFVYNNAIVSLWHYIMVFTEALSYP